MIKNRKKGQQEIDHTCCLRCLFLSLIISISLHPSTSLTTLSILLPSLELGPVGDEQLEPDKPRAVPPEY